MRPICLATASILTDSSTRSFPSPCIERCSDPGWAGARLAFSSIPHIQYTRRFEDDHTYQPL